MNNPVDLKTIEMWIRTQIARPNADPVIPRSWYKYARECREWRHLTYGNAPGFCRLGKIAGRRINEEYGGLDMIKLHFPCIWAHSMRKWRAT